MGAKRLEWDYVVQRMPDKDMNTKALVELLRRMGKQHWELASIVHTPEGYLLPFKRPWIPQVKAED